MQGKWLLFPSWSLCNIAFLTLLNRPGCPGWFSVHRYSLRKSPSAQDSCFMFQLLSRSWKASTFNQEPSEFSWKVTYLYLSLTLSVAKLLGFWRKPPFLAYSPLCSWSSWPLQTRLERNLKNAGQDEDHFAALPWILSSWPGTSDSLGGSAS